MSRLRCLLILLICAHCSSSGEVSPDLGLGTLPDLAASPDDQGMPLADLGGADLGGLAAAKICSSDGWCWESPLPQGNTLLGAWGASPNIVWAVGQAGTIL